MGELESVTPVKGSLTLVDFDGVGLPKFTFHFNPTNFKDSHSPTWAPQKIPGSSHPIYQWGGSGERVISFTLRLDGDRGRLHRTSATSGVRPNINSGLNPLDRLMKQAQASIGTSVLAASGLRGQVGFVRSGAKIVAGNANFIAQTQQDFPAVQLREARSSTLKPGDPLGLSVEDELNFFRRFSHPGKSGNNVTAPPRVIFNMGKAYRGLECVCVVESINVTMLTPAMEPVRADVALQLKEFIRQPVFRSSVITK